MAADGRELLVIVDEGSVRPGSAELFDRFPIRLAAPPHVFVIDVPAETSAAEVAALPGVAAVTDGDLAPEVLERLDRASALFVRAWASRSDDAKPHRPGDGTDWDADGFEPPDAPSGTEPDGREGTTTGQNVSEGVPWLEM